MLAVALSCSILLLIANYTRMKQGERVKGEARVKKRSRYLIKSSRLRIDPPAMDKSGVLTCDFFFFRGPSSSLTDETGVWMSPVIGGCRPPTSGVCGGVGILTA